MGQAFLNLSEDDRLFLSRIEDLFAVSRNRNIAKFSHFLDERQTYLAQGLAARQPERYRFFGGYGDAQRMMLGVFPDYLEPDEDLFPFSAVTALFRKEDSLSHRDVLGALMSLRIKREAVGDLLVEPGRAVLFLEDSVAPLVLGEIQKIGRVGVKLFPGFQDPLPKGMRFLEITGTVASLRLDAVTSMATGQSREKSQTLIQSGAVSVNYMEQQNGSFPLKAGDVLRIRGYGKFLLGDQMRQTKKDRLFITWKKYV